MDPHTPYQVPIAPGRPEGEPVTLTSLMPPAPQPRRRRWLIPTIAVLAVLVAATGAAVYLFAIRPGKLAVPGIAPAVPPLADASAKCGEVGQLGDGDKTLVLDMQGKKSGSGSMDIDEVKCVLAELKTPSYVLAQMDSTRALDGRETATWGAFEASWTYHPDDGLDVIVRQVK